MSEQELDIRYRYLDELEERAVVAAERQADALERIAAVLESMTSKGNEYLSVGVMK